MSEKGKAAIISTGSGAPAGSQDSLTAGLKGSPGKERDLPKFGRSFYKEGEEWHIKILKTS